MLLTTDCSERLITETDNETSIINILSTHRKTNETFEGDANIIICIWAPMLNPSKAYCRDIAAFACFPPAHTYRYLRSMLKEIYYVVKEFPSEIYIEREYIVYDHLC